MEIAALILIWPFILLTAGLVFAAFYDVFPSGLGLFWLPALVIFILLVRSRNKASEDMVLSKQIFLLKKFLTTFSIAMLFPIFTRYLVGSFDNSLPVIIVGLIIGFALIIWGMFMERNKTIVYSNIIGGAIVLVYIFIKIWELGEGARIIAASFGLLVAVAVSIIKLKDKLT
ncbi:MAG TPA: hypothetical protein PKL09_03980 [bacterium]|nr:hypothetical protein [bacterium]HNS34425.1 hypothetical protein [bacterium]HNW09407.1 hypothetical protein [bacterium]HNZ73757.1 hypothetical protein [bacterium]HOH67663.1 hypothetical protein [bacterium]